MNSTAPPAVSVLMPVYNGTRFLKSAFDVLSKQTRKDFEVILVDDGSKDGTEAMSRELLAASGLQGKVIRSQNRGCEQARDLCCTNSAGAIIAPYDCDDIWHPTYLEEMAGVLDRNPEVEVVYCDFDEDFVNDKKVVRKSLTTPWIDRSKAKKVGSDLYVFPHGVFFDLLLQGQVLFPPCTMCRRSVYDRVNGYSSVNPQLRVSLDWCYGLRASRVSVVAYLDKPLLEKSRHGGNVSGNQIKTATEDVIVLEGILKDPGLTPSQRRHARHRASIRAVNTAYQEWFLNGNVSAARRWLFRALAHEWSKRAVVLLAKTFLPKSLVSAARQSRAEKAA